MAPPIANEGLRAGSLHAPRGTICLLSALVVHELTEEFTTEVTGSARSWTAVRLRDQTGTDIAHRAARRLLDDRGAQLVVDEVEVAGGGAGLDVPDEPLGGVQSIPAVSTSVHRSAASGAGGLTRPPRLAPHRSRSPLTDQRQYLPVDRPSVAASAGW